MNDPSSKMKFVLLSPKGPFTRLDVLPFILLYPLAISLTLFLEIPSWISQVTPVFFLLSQGITFLLSYWSVRMKSKIRFSRVGSLSKATHVLATKHFRKENRNRTVLCPLCENNGYFLEYYKQKYIYDPQAGTFVKQQWRYDRTFEEYRTSLGMVNEEELRKAKEKHGNNEMNIPMPKFLELFQEHIVAPFFVFQVFCTMLWMFEEYWYFSAMSFVMLFVFESSVIFSRLKNMERIRGMRIRHREMKVYRGMRWTTVNSEQLVPGDIVSIELRPGGDTENRLPCDMLLLSGNCTVNESILTGESIPLAKEPITARDSLSERFELKSGQHKSHILFGRTEVLHCSRDLGKPLNLLIPSPPSNKSCVAYVLRTGFETTQGKLVRTVLFTAERVTVESKEAYGFLLLLLFFALLAAGYTLWEGLQDPERNKYKVIVKSILILAAVVPPELPMELSMAVNSSIIALIRNGIFCTEPYRIPLAGKITTCCFDKTGTLTSDKIKINGILDENGQVQDNGRLNSNAKFVIGMCHGLTLGDTVLGDPMEKLAFEQVGWKYDRIKEKVETEDGKTNGEVLAKYPFSSQLKRMSVLANIVENGRETNKVLTKGAPEVIKSMLAEIPPEFDTVVKKCTKEGARLICMAYKDTDYSSKVPREEIEKSLHFCGFIATSCPLKKECKTQIQHLLQSHHRVIIITGDNQYTAAHVCFELEIAKPGDLAFFKPSANATEQPCLVDIDDNLVVQSVNSKDFLLSSKGLCITGDGLAFIDTLPSWTDQEKAKILQKALVFARVSPSQKDHIVGILNKSGEFTLMCGDGTNDVGSLKRAHAGIALLNREETAEEKKRNETLFLKAMNEPIAADGDASIAAPFTYKYESVKCVADILRQGRCALVTTIQMYKILAINCLMLAYSLSVLYQQGLKSGDMQSTVFAIPITIYFYFISNAKPLNKLHPYKPPHSIFVISQIVPVAIQFVTHIIGLAYLTQLGLKHTPPEEMANPDGSFKPSVLNTVVMIYLSFVDATNFFINYEGEPFMESLWSGKVLPKILILHVAGLVAGALDVSEDLRWLLQLKELPQEFPGYMLVGIMALDFAICFAVRVFVRKKLYGRA